MTDERRERRVQAVVAAMMHYYKSAGLCDHGAVVTLRAQEFLAMLDAVTPSDMRWTPDE